MGLSTVLCLDSFTPLHREVNGWIWLHLNREWKGGGGFQTAGGLRVKSYFKVHFLFVMVSSKGRVDRDVWLLYVPCLCCAALCPFKHLILFLEHDSRSARPPKTAFCVETAPWQENDRCWTDLCYPDRLQRTHGCFICSSSRFNAVIKAGLDKTRKHKAASNSVTISHNACYAFPLHL